MDDYLWAPSDDEEMWHHMDPNDAAQELLESVSQDQEINEGDKFTIYCGECFYPKPSAYLPDVVAQMTDAADYASGEASEDWLTKESAELEEAIKEFVDKWCEDHDCLPKFGTIRNIQAAEIVVTKVNEFDFGWEFADNLTNQREDEQ